MDERTVEVLWNDNTNKRYLTAVYIHTNTTDNHMLDLMQTISMINVSVDSMNTVSKVDKVTYEVLCYVTGIEQLNKMILALEKNQYVEKVERVMR